MAQIWPFIINLARELILTKFPSDLPLIYVIQFKICPRWSSSWCLKNSINFQFFIFLKFNFQIVLGLTLQNWVLPTLLYHYANIYDFWTTFAASIEWKKRWERKLYENKCKTAYKTIEEGKANGFDSWRRVDIRFCSWGSIVKGGKVDFSQ